MYPAWPRVAYLPASRHGSRHPSNSRWNDNLSKCFDVCYESKSTGPRALTQTSAKHLHTWHPARRMRATLNGTRCLPYKHLLQKLSGTPLESLILEIQRNAAFADGRKINRTFRFSGKLSKVPGGNSATWEEEKPYRVINYSVTCTACHVHTKNLASETATRKGRQGSRLKELLGTWGWTWTARDSGAFGWGQSEPSSNVEMQKSHRVFIVVITVWRQNEFPHEKKKNAFLPPVAWISVF